MENTLTIEALNATIATFRRGFVVEPNAGKIIESPHMVDGPFEDWSRVRSPSRARRRRARGHRQNISHYYSPKPGFLKLPDGTMVGHPATVSALRQKLRVGMERRMDQMTEAALFGSPFI